MGRFGDVLLVGGEPDLSLTAQLGEVVRLYLTNTANTRVFKVALPGARMKLVGGDSGHVEHEQFVDDVILAPSERVDRRCPVRPGRASSRWSTTRPDRVYPLAAITVSEERGRAGAGGAVRGPAHQSPTWRPSVSAIAPYLEAEPDKTRGVHRRDGHGCAGGRRAGRLHLPDASGGRQRGARPLPAVRHEAARGRGAGDHLHLPDAPAGGQRAARPLPGLRHEAAAGAARRRGRRPRARRPRPRATASTSTRATTTRRPAASSGKTTWSPSTG